MMWLKVNGAIRNIFLTSLSFFMIGIVTPTEAATIFDCDGDGQADPNTTSCPFNDLITNSGSIQIDDKRFSMFSVDNNNTTIPLNNITVHEANGAEGMNLPGLRFFNGAAPGGFPSGMFDLMYQVEVTDNSKVISDIYALLGGGTNPVTLLVEPGNNGKEFKQFTLPNLVSMKKQLFDQVVKSLKVHLKLNLPGANSRTNKFVTTFSQTNRPNYTEDPFLSWSLTHFDANTGELSIGGPDATFIAAQPTELPIINSVIDTNGNFTDDLLVGALLDYSGIFLDKENDDGTFSFTNGSLEAINPSNPSDILFSADIVDVLADPNNSMFSAKLRNFVPGSVSPSSSPLLAELVSAGIAEFWLDPSIIELTKSGNEPFAQTGTTVTPYLQDFVTPVPEPSSMLALLALGTLGAGATLKRKVKHTNFIEKETTKVG